MEGAPPVLPRAQRKQQESAKPKAKGKAKPKAKSKSKPKAKSKAKSEPKPKAEEPVTCGDCGQEFPNAREAANHMRDEHNSQEAAGSGP